MKEENINTHFHMYIACRKVSHHYMAAAVICICWLAKGVFSGPPDMDEEASIEIYLPTLFCLRS